MSSTIEIGHFCVILALILSISQFLIISLGNLKGWVEWISIGIFITPIVSFLVLMGLLSILFAFIRSDFSLMLVAQHSHSLKPMLYKITGLWGNHEGSMMLWVFIMSLFSLLLFLLRHQYPVKFFSYLLISQSIIVSAFLYYLIFASNPFVRILTPPPDGLGLNPVLQDPALAFHPPMLYLGYVGLCISYSFAVAGMIEGKVDSRWASWVRPWTLVSWIFLTIGISLGSWWAYYELGWGGFGFGIQWKTHH